MKFNDRLVLVMTLVALGGCGSGTGTTGGAGGGSGGGTGGSGGTNGSATLTGSLAFVPASARAWSQADAGSMLNANMYVGLFSGVVACNQFNTVPSGTRYVFLQVANATGSAKGTFDPPRFSPTRRELATHGVQGSSMEDNLSGTFSLDWTGTTPMGNVTGTLDLAVSLVSDAGTMKGTFAATYCGAI